MLTDGVKQLLPVFIVNFNIRFSLPHTVLIHGQILFFLQVPNSVGDNCTSQQISTKDKSLLVLHEFGRDSR